MFLFWPSHLILSGAISNYPLHFPSSILDIFIPGGLILCHIFLPFHTAHGILNSRILKLFAIPFSRGHVLSEPSTMLHLSWVALHGMAHSFNELDKAVVHVIILVSFL